MLGNSYSKLQLFLTLIGSIKSIHLCNYLVGISMDSHDSAYAFILLLRSKFNDSCRVCLTDYAFLQRCCHSFSNVHFCFATHTVDIWMLQQISCSKARK